MADDQLMLMLPSDASSTLYPENKIGDYKIRFQQPIDLAPAAYEDGCGKPGVSLRLGEVRR